ncbi:c-type cytochrome [bacterium]|nr:c-type cytochrome [bacterium]
MIAFLFVLNFGCTESVKIESEEKAIVEPKNKELQEEARVLASRAFGVIPDEMPGSESDTFKKIALGKSLYFEKRLSVNQSQSCNTCHRVDGDFAGVDNEATSKGALGHRVHRNSPTVLNAGFQFAQFWDGRAADLKDQAKGPILAKGEMEMPSEESVLEIIKSDNSYVSMFEGVYGRGAITYDNLADAIAAFERQLITKDKFDEFQKGSVDFAEQELRGFNLFVQTGCASCHNGFLFGGNSYQKVGVIEPYMPDGKITEDLGLYNITKKEDDKYFFKVPSLRNIERTYPYFHDGKVKTLKEAISIMAQIQLGKKLEASEVEDIEVFFKNHDRLC